jgi:hypothetical protein
MPYNLIVMPMQLSHERIGLFQGCGTRLHRLLVSKGVKYVIPLNFPAQKFIQVSIENSYALWTDTSARESLGFYEPVDGVDFQLHPGGDLLWRQIGMSHAQIIQNHSRKFNPRDFLGNYSTQVTANTGTRVDIVSKA